MSAAEVQYARAGAAPCLKCGTTGGHVAAGRQKPFRAGGLCHRCYKKGYAETYEQLVCRPRLFGADNLPDAEQAELLARLRVPHAPAVMAAARETLIVRNLRLAGFAARKRTDKTREDFDVLLSHAMVGLIFAVDHFRPEVGVKFSSYAVTCINGQMTQHAANERELIRLPANARWPDSGRTSKKYGAYAEKAVETFQLTDLSTSFLAAPADESPDCGDREAVAKAVGAALRALPGRLPEVVRLRYGLGGGEPATLRAVAAEFGVSPERVRSMETAALRSLRRSLDAHRPPGVPGADELPRCPDCGKAVSDGRPCAACKKNAWARDRARRKGVAS